MLVYPIDEGTESRRLISDLRHAFEKRSELVVKPRLVSLCGKKSCPVLVYTRYEIRALPQDLSRPFRDLGSLDPAFQKKYLAVTKRALPAQTESASCI